MKRFFTKSTAVIYLLGLSATTTFAGNKDRTGQSGATELLINPWGLSTGVFGMNTAYVGGIDAMKTNIAGLAFVRNTEVGLSRSEILSGSGIGVNNAAIAQKIGNFGVLGFNVMSVSFGEITKTDWNYPEGGIGTYKPQFLNISLGFAKQFSESIYAGIAGTFVSEQISNINASGAAFEAGVQYVTGKRDNFHFGVTLRNVGTNMRFNGSGFAVESPMPDASDPSTRMSLRVPTEKFEMPTYLNFGVAYDIYLDENLTKSEDEKPKHRLTPMFSFTSNSFLNDYYGGGLEYAFKETFMLRGAYRYEKDINNAATPSTFYTGISAGASIQKSIGKNGPILAIDYSYRATQRPANGVHVVTLRLMTLAKAKDSESAE
ncbi:MAG TPA: PorV/PorQ family protein [Flavipsychrobacter sp.]|jgi:hypothetical protein|nr:PorV/PorQ family protein [Flavipsychrobacter sp.]